MALTDQLNTQWNMILSDKVSTPLAGIKRHADQAERSMDGLDKKTMSFGDKIKSSFGISGNVLAGVGGFVAGFATNALTTFTSGAMQAAADADNATKQIEAGLRSTRGVSGQTVDSLLADADRLRNQSLFGDDEIVMKLQAQLLTFTNITGTNFKRTEQAAIDLATRLGGDLQGSAIMLGKALNDPIQGLTALRRVGVGFTEDQRKIIENLVKQNDLFGAQKLILDNIEEQYGGSGAAAADSMAGALHRQKEAVEDLQEAWGGLLFKSGIVQGAADFFNNLSFIFSGASAQKQMITDKFSTQFDQMFKGGYTPADFKQGQAPGIRYADSGMTLTSGQLDAYRSYYNSQIYPAAAGQQANFANQFGGGRAMLAKNGLNGPFMPGQSFTMPAGMPMGAGGTSLQALQDKLKDLQDQYGLATTAADRKSLLPEIASVERQIKALTDPLSKLNSSTNKELGGINSKVTTEKTPRIITLNITNLVNELTVNGTSGEPLGDMRNQVAQALTDAARDVEQGLSAN